MLDKLSLQMERLGGPTPVTGLVTFYEDEWQDRGQMKVIWSDQSDAVWARG